jgi:putative hydrolase of the HAD superfamily
MQRMAVSFDFGQVLAGFDPSFLVEKLLRRGRPGASAGKIEEALPEAWNAYGQVLRAVPSGRTTSAIGWKAFMRTLLERADVPEITEALLDDLLADQRALNLWRKPIPGMIELVRTLRRDDVPVAIVSNSEGALNVLIDQLGWTEDLPIVVDSGVLGIEKPDPRIFAWAAGRLGVRLDAIVHVGDSWVADVEGALHAGAKAVWFPALDDRAAHDDRVRPATNAAEVAEALRSLGV